MFVKSFFTAHLPGAIFVKIRILICVSKGFPAAIFLALGECLMAVTRPLSMVDLKDARGYFRERILTEGLVIYDVAGIPERSPVWA